MQMTALPTKREWLDAARSFEDSGYDTISLPDHLGPQFAPVPALAAVAAVTERVRLSMFVMANDFRNPAVLAKEITSLDVLSDGRVELGLGAGWNAAEYAAQGVQFDSPGVRIDRLAEAVVLLRQAFAGELVDFSGEHYRVEGLEVLPRPVGHIPLVLGGGGRRMLSLAAREADVVGIATNNQARTREVAGTPGLARKAFAKQVAWVREAARDRVTAPVLNVRVLGVCVCPSLDDGRETVARELGVDRPLIEDSPFVFAGPVEAVHEQMLRNREEFGVTYYTVSQRHAEQLAPLVARVANS
jgi:probable F420-dependent oxidoreductase